MDAESAASLARELKGRGAKGVGLTFFPDEEEGDEGESAEGAGRRMVAGRANGMAAVTRKGAVEGVLERRRRGKEVSKRWLKEEGGPERLVEGGRWAGKVG